MSAANTDPKTRRAQPDHAARLREANINPDTGFATDYLNHFNEAIMLLELLAETPECLEDFFAWQPKKYGEHFAASKSRHRGAALDAYAEADPVLRERLDTLADSMNAILTATREVMQQDRDNNSAIAGLAARWVRPLLVRASDVINGTKPAGERGGSSQSAVDALMAR